MKQTKQQAKETLQTQLRQAAQAAGMDTLTGSALVELLAVRQSLTEGAATDTLLQQGRVSVPALIAGLLHQNGKIRATCALLLDHVADDRCVEPLLEPISIGGIPR